MRSAPKSGSRQGSRCAPAVVVESSAACICDRRANHRCACPVAPVPRWWRLLSSSPSGPNAHVKARARATRGDESSSTAGPPSSEPGASTRHAHRRVTRGVGTGKCSWLSRRADGASSSLLCASGCRVRLHHPGQLSHINRLVRPDGLPVPLSSCPVGSPGFSGLPLFQRLPACPIPHRRGGELTSLCVYTCSKTGSS